MVQRRLDNTPYSSAKSAQGFFYGLNLVQSEKGLKALDYRRSPLDLAQGDLDLVLGLGREDRQLGAGAAREGAGLVHVVLGPG